MSKMDSHWKKRVLCSDGNCIGIIGNDGRCKECGLVYDGELPTGADEPDTEVDDVDASAVSQSLSGDSEQAGGDPQENSDTTEDAWENPIGEPIHVDDTSELTDPQGKPADSPGEAQCAGEGPTEHLEHRTNPPHQRNSVGRGRSSPDENRRQGGTHASGHACRG